jgi:hypothetical protein
VRQIQALIQEMDPEEMETFQEECKEAGF